MENQRSQVKLAMNYGTLYGLASIASYLLFYFIGTNVQSKMPQYSGWILLIIFLCLGIKSYRDEDLGGHINYGRALGTGTLISLFGGILIAAFTLCFFTLIAPDMTQKILDAAQQSMAERGMTEEQMEMGLSYTRKFMTPMWLFLFSIIGSVFMGFVFSLVISIFMKKEQNPFSSNLG